jgi:phosphate-selective porin OprO/OprP
MRHTTAIWIKTLQADLTGPFRPTTLANCEEVRVRLTVHLRAAATIVALTATAAPALAQSSTASDAPTPPVAAQTAQTSSTPAAPVAGWSDGFFLQSPNGDYKLNLGSIVQMDGRFALGDDKPITNTFTMRKARVIFVGQITKYFSFRIMPDFAGGAAQLFDAYLDFRPTATFRVRTGKDKTPLGYEALLSDPTLPFPERALPTALLPNRDVGVQAIGELMGGKVSYAGGVFNGVPDGTSSSTELDTNNGKDVAGRITLQPFREPGASPTAQSGLGFHVGASTGNEVGALSSFKTSVGQTYFSYAANATASGRRNRVAPGVFYYHDRLGAYGEYIRSSQDITRAGVTQTVTNDGWEFTGAYMLTGERASDKLPKPAKNFDPTAHTWGAFQIVARASHIQFDAAAFGNGFTGAGASRKALQWTVGANWYPNPVVKYQATFERTVFDGDASGPRPAENVVLFRCQVAF